MKNDLRVSARSPEPAASPLLRSSPSAARRPPFTSNGFTLLELLVVVVIIGVIVSAATLSVGVLGGDRELEDEARRVWAVLQQAQEETELQGINVGMFAAASDYEFLQYDARRAEWRSIVGDALYRPRELPDGLRFRIWLDGREVVLKPQPPSRGDPDENKRNPPQIMVLSNGEVMPFELHIERDAAPALFRVVATVENDLRLEKREGLSDWRIVAQTRAPLEAEPRT